MKEYVIVGGGIGGCMIASILKKHNPLIIEATNYVGGCASTYKRKEYLYNSGATTIMGLNENMPTGKIAKLTDTKLNNLKLIDNVISVKYKDKTIDRYSDFDMFLEQISKFYPHKKQREFWLLVYNICKKFFQLDLYFNKQNIKEYIKSIYSLSKVITNFPIYSITNAKKFITSFFGEENRDFFEYIDNQILIVAQSKSENVSFLNASLALGYHFFDNYYVNGGMKSIVDDFVNGIDIAYNNKIEKIDILKDRFLLHSKKEIFEAKKVILNSTIFDTKEIFENHKMVKYYDKLIDRFKTNQSACVLFMSIKTDKKFNHHYQLINEKDLPFCISNSLFVSISDIDDKVMSKDNIYSINISIHTDVMFWINITKESYKNRKEILKNALLDIFFRYFDINKNDIKDIHLSTPLTYKKYTNRFTLGGIPATQKNFTLSYPSMTTPQENLYHIGDSVFASQGYAGVSIGVLNLAKILGKI